MVELTFCSAKDCKEFAWCRDLCFKHFMQFKRSDGFTPQFILKDNECSNDGCANKKIGKGLCWKHYRRQLRSYYRRATWLCLILHAVPYWQCHVRGCKRFKKTKNFCTLHYQRYRKWGKPSIVKSQAKHGMYGTPTYNSWQSMIQRCINPKTTGYAKYGGRGIKVCDRWRYSFSNFYADMGERPEGKTIHRIELDGDYEPGNCKWATAHEQALQSRLPSTNKSGYRGVHYDRGAWTASIGPGNETLYLGRFKDKELAAKAYNQAAIVHFGPEAMLNPV